MEIRHFEVKSSLNRRSPFSEVTFDLPEEFTLHNEGLLRHDYPEVMARHLIEMASITRENHFIDAPFGIVPVNPFGIVLRGTVGLSELERAIKLQRRIEIRRKIKRAQEMSVSEIYL